MLLKCVPFHCATLHCYRDTHCNTFSQGFVWQSLKARWRPLIMQHYGLQSSTMVPTSFQVQAGAHEAHTQIHSNSVTNSQLHHLPSYTFGSISNMIPPPALTPFFAPISLSFSITLPSLPILRICMKSSSSSQAGFFKAWPSSVCVTPLP